MGVIDVVLDVCSEIEDSTDVSGVGVGIVRLEVAVIACVVFMLALTPALTPVLTPAIALLEDTKVGWDETEYCVVC